MAEQLELNRLHLVKDSFIDETLQEHFSDLVYEVALRNHGSAFVCVLFEHKSYVDTLTPLQLLRYRMHGWDYALRQRNRLWPVIPVVIYHGAAPWIVARNFQGLFATWRQPVKMSVQKMCGRQSRPLHRKEMQ